MQFNTSQREEYRCSVKFCSHYRSFWQLSTFVRACRYNFPSAIQGMAELLLWYVTFHRQVVAASRVRVFSNTYAFSIANGTAKNNKFWTLQQCCPHGGSSNSHNFDFDFPDPYSPVYPPPENPCFATLSPFSFASPDCFPGLCAST